MGTLSDLDYELRLIKAEIQDRNQPLAQWLNTVLSETDTLMGDINCAAYRFLSKSEMLEALEIDENDLRVMAHIATRLQLIASNIYSREEPKLKVVR